MPATRRLEAFCLLAILAGLGGCAAPDEGLACPPSNNLGRVISIDGTVVRVQLLQSSLGFRDAVLETAGAEVLYYAGSSEECYESRRALLTEGQEIQFHVDAWSASEPPQATVDAVTIRG